MSITVKLYTKSTLEKLEINNAGAHVFGQEDIVTFKKPSAMLLENLTASMVEDTGVSCSVFNFQDDVPGFINNVEDIDKATNKLLKKKRYNGVMFSNYVFSNEGSEYLNFDNIVERLVHLPDNNINGGFFACDPDSLGVFGYRSKMLNIDSSLDELGTRLTFLASDLKTYTDATEGRHILPPVMADAAIINLASQLLGVLDKFIEGIDETYRAEVKSKLTKQLVQKLSSTSQTLYTKGT